MKNKRGTTLVEIVISVSLISIVMIFLFRLLTDMQYEENHASFAKENQLTRAEILRKVQEDFLNLTLVDASLSAQKDTITLNFKNSVSKTIKLTEKKLNYNDEQSWDIVGTNDETKLDIAHTRLEKNQRNSSCTDIYTSGMNCSYYYSIRIIIPVTTGDKDNIIDDIEFFYIGHI